jgi:hypothetical protein
MFFVRQGEGKALKLVAEAGGFAVKAYKSNDVGVFQLQACDTAAYTYCMRV